MSALPIKTTSEVREEATMFLTWLSLNQGFVCLLVDTHHWNTTGTIREDDIITAGDILGPLEELGIHVPDSHTSLDDIRYYLETDPLFNMYRI